ncbi:bifunctional folylpolyglutamate synthase/dihydrofolate synthase [Marinihelvus fidelis]|uniref:Dihydrofolate synthase/folylpolyglutamate synthase n=1 Tax=Marinihelvus fidelis TaxID=2613842 RepID=A0A5N0TAM6_9GAMM|nr:folylpolyglutamate synthase/dihydrofolate synthase family protein [Marinihelvus fidelis]KAA9132065.1 bifunctional folylpolyglutamate synthase/dihydrofolate synthase [Marinihelvus fidelis]
MSPALTDWLALLERRHPVEIDLGLERCGQLWQRLGAPRPGRHVVTVAGTNGKGSTVATICALAQALGWQTAAYTSPHLLVFNERLRINGEPVDDDSLVDAFDAVEAARGDISLTYFEFTTLACLLLSAQRQPDLAVLEVGLGGRLDTVNLVDADVAVITPVGLDHQAFLGNDRETIGAEKAGILRPGIPLVCTETAPPASVLERATRLGCQVHLAGRDYHCEPSAEGVRFRMGAIDLALPAPALAGRHQVDNLGAALAAIAQLRPDLGEEADRVADAIRGVRLPGRLYSPPGHGDVLLDVGHNPMAAAVVAQQLADQAPVVCVLAMLADKDAVAAVTELAPVVGEWHFAGLSGSRGQGGEALAARVGAAVGQAETAVHDRVEIALDAAMRAADGRKVLVFGSFHTVAEAMLALSERAS